MKAIMLMFDSLNRHFLPSYGCPASKGIKTPNFDRLAERTVRFERSYAGSLPCMPARRELHTGRYNFLHRGWGAIEPYDDSMPELLKNAGVYTHMISDHQHYWEDGGATYHHRYNTWEIVRGHEGDCWKAQVKDPQIPPHLGQAKRQDVINRSYMRTAADQPQNRVFELGFEFLERNREEDNWFLHWETFDPHEPFFTMPEYKQLYRHEYAGPHFDWPDYAPVKEGERDAVAHVRYEYAALLAMCDENLGRVLDYMDAHDMWRDTMLIVNTDHGFLLGEHDWWAKMMMPMYEEISHTPLFIWDPRCPQSAGQTRSALVQTIDIAPTLLEFFGQKIPADMEGKPLGKVIKADIPIRQAALFGQHGAQVNVTDGRYVYLRACAREDNTPLYDYVHIPTHMRQLYTVEEMRTMQIAPPFSFTKGCPVMKIRTPGFSPHACKAGAAAAYGEQAVADDPRYSEIYTTMLFDLKEDPGQLHPIHDEQIEARMTRLMIELMKANDAPAEQYERLGLDV